MLHPIYQGMSWQEMDSYRKKNFPHFANWGAWFHQDYPHMEHENDGGKLQSELITHDIGVRLREWLKEGEATCKQVSKEIDAILASCSSSEECESLLDIDAVGFKFYGVDLWQILLEVKARLGGMGWLEFFEASRKRLGN